MRTEDRVRKALHSVRITQSITVFWLSSLRSRRQTPTFPSIRVCWLLIPCALGLLSCSTGRSPPPTAPKAAVGTHHLVRPGETLAAIGRLYEVRWQTLAQVNQLVDPHRIEVGQAIWIPSKAGTGGSSAPTLAVPSRFIPDRRLQWPTDGLLSSVFGMRGGRFHCGIDI
jgi:LysM repeat protein